MRRCLLWSVMLLLPAALPACGGTTYPDDRPNWDLVSTPNAPNGFDVSGALNLSDAGNGELQAFLFESSKLDLTGQSLSITWNGTWTGDKSGADLSLSCTQEDSSNVNGPDCKTATLKVSCEVVGLDLKCGDYTFH